MSLGRARSRKERIWPALVTSWYLFVTHLEHGDAARVACLQDRVTGHIDMSHGHDGKSSTST